MKKGALKVSSSLNTQSEVGVSVCAAVYLGEHELQHKFPYFVKNNL